MEAIQAQLALAGELSAAGVLIHSGLFADGTAGAYLFRAASRQDAEALVARDPPIAAAAAAVTTVQAIAVTNTIGE